jgi:hypothetical protein
MAAVAALLLLANAACSAASPAAPRVGDEVEIIRSYETREQGDGSSGSSSGRDALLERVLAVRDGGLELEFDLPKSATAEDRARSWQFPVRVFRAADGTMQLRNRAELETRIDAWLERAGWTREACGQWIFTWNAFLIECDPASVVVTLAAFDLRSAAIHDGASYREAEALAAGTLTQTATGPDGATFTVVLPIDPDAVRRARAESDVAVGQMLQKPVTLADALRERAKEDVSGTIEVTFETDSAGTIRKRTRVTSVETQGPDGRTGTQTATETVERRPA